MTKVEYAVNWCIKIAEDNSHGYDQGNRWGPDYDCSSLIISAYEAAGIPVKSSGAINTQNMLPVFQKCGFFIVQGWDRQTGAGLIAGDVLLNVKHHTEICIGNGQLLKASSNEFKGRTGGKVGDQTGEEIRIGEYYLYKNGGWDYALRYKNQSEQYTGSMDSLTSFNFAMTGNIQPDVSKINAYVVSVDRNTDSIDSNKLQSLKVIGLFAEAGYLYDVSHMMMPTYVNPKLNAQIEAAKSAEIPYGLVPIVRARNVQEATEELRWLRIYIQKYVPPLGVWLKLDLVGSVAMNDMIIEKYQDILWRSGLKGKIGFYVTRDQLSKVSWDKWQETFYLWLVDHISDMSEMEQLLTPEFFDL